MKKLLAILLALIMIFALTACNDDEPAEKNTKTQNETEPQSEVSETVPEEIPEELPEEIPEELASTKTLAYFQKFLSGGEYTMEMKTSAEGMEMTMKSAYKGDMIYSESEYAGQKSIMVMKEGFQYIIDHSTKTVMKMQVVDNGAVMDMFSDEAANYETVVASGTTEYNGKTYDYEEFTVEGETMQYLFDGNDLKIMKANVMGTESIVEIISLEKGADASLFEIPEDYQMITY